MTTSMAQPTGEDHSDAFKEAVIELGESIALGAVPFLGQAIDAYDTVESAIRWYENKDSRGEALDEAKFDFLLSLFGWLPGPGDGVKKSLRLVNKDPGRFAPVLFDLLRFVLKECRVKTSPEVLLTQIFDASQLQSAIADIREGIKDSAAFEALPDDVGAAILGILDMAGRNIGPLLDIVATRLSKWKAHSANSSASGRIRNPNGKNKPGSEKQDKPQAANRPSSKKNDEDTKRDKAAILSPNAITGVAGEHIADYICAQKFGWGTNWKGHDRGGQGEWVGPKPGANTSGKLSNNGFLFKRTDPPNGTGIDAVWRADRNNGGKPYAIVEAKASAVPKRSKKGKKGKKNDTGAAPFTNVARPSAYSLLGDNSRTIRHGGTVPLLVQMSIEWVRKNLPAAVKPSLVEDIGERGYCRHLFYAPHWHPSGSSKIHMELPGKSPENKHRLHAAFYYSEAEIKEYVNKRKQALENNYPGHEDTLRKEI